MTNASAPKTQRAAKPSKSVRPMPNLPIRAPILTTTIVAPIGPDFK